MCTITVDAAAVEAIAGARLGAVGPRRRAAAAVQQLAEGASALRSGFPMMLDNHV